MNETPMRRMRTSVNGHRITAIALLLLVSASLKIYGQDSRIDDRSDQIIANCIEAMGGQMEFARIENVTVRGKIGRTALPESSFELKVGENTVRLEENGGETITFFNGETLWQTGKSQRHVSVEKNDHGSLQFLPIPGIVQNWVEFEGIIRFAGSEQIDGLDTWDIEFRDANDLTFNLYFDSDTGLLVRKKAFGAMYHYEYRSIRGVQLIKRIFRVDESGITGMFFDADSWDLQTVLPAELFDLPGKLDGTTKHK